jgi:hypothetical protein
MNESSRIAEPSSTRGTRILAAGSVALAITVVVSTASADPPPLPQEAFTACEGKASGDACSVTFREHTMEGTCTAGPEGGKLHCRPSGPPPGH